MSQTEISITGEPISDATCRFTVDRPVYPDKSFAFLSKEAAEGSPLAQRLFAIDGITRVVISHDQITINKSARVDWPVIGTSIGVAIRAHLATGRQSAEHFTGRLLVARVTLLVAAISDSRETSSGLSLL